MLFPEAKSSLVRLSDCIKFGIAAACDTSSEFLELHKAHAQDIAVMRDAAREALAGRISMEEAEKVGRIQSAKIPADTERRAISLQGRLHSECLSVLLQVCFALESYVNAYAYYLLKEKDFLGLVRKGNDATAELLFEAIDRLSTPSKWETLGRLNHTVGFDTAKAPFQDLKVLFYFRNDIVHDKVREYSDDVAAKRYGGKLPDPTFGFLDLRHVVYAADTYWMMILEIHRLTSEPRDIFHRHYNLAPWFSPDTERHIRDIARQYCAVQDV